MGWGRAGVLPCISCSEALPGGSSTTLNVGATDVKQCVCSPGWPDSGARPRSSWKSQRFCLRRTTLSHTALSLWFLCRPWWRVLPGLPARLLEVDKSFRPGAQQVNPVTQLNYSHKQRPCGTCACSTNPCESAADAPCCVFMQSWGLRVRSTGRLPKVSRYFSGVSAGGGRQFG